MADLPTAEQVLPKNRGLFINNEWRDSHSGQRKDTFNPGNGQVIASISEAGAADVDAAAQAAHAAFQTWGKTEPGTRAACLRQAAAQLRQHATELAMLDTLNTGNPISRMLDDANTAATSLEYFAGLIPMLKGETIPQASSGFHYTVREPLGVVARIITFNHPVMFAGAKIGPALAAGNTLILKPPEQAPLSALRLAELLQGVFPPGVLNVLPGGAECGQAMATHPLVRKVTLIGSRPTGSKVARAAADSLKGTQFELGGKNALIALPDADVDKLVAGIGRGMNFTWAGQSCGSMSRVFLHESLHDAVLDRVVEFVAKNFRPGVPTDMATTMGPVISKAAHERILGCIESGRQDGATLVAGGRVPGGDAAIAGGYFIEPTIFKDVDMGMRIAREEIFGPVMSVFKWSDEAAMLRDVNATEYGLTAAIYTRDVAAALDLANKVQSGYVWVNQVSRHFLNVPFGGYKQSGMGREECIEEMVGFTQTKSVNVDISR